MDNLASSGGSDDHHRTDGSRDSKRLMQDERRAQHGERQLDVAHKRHLLRGKIAHRAEVEHIGESCLDEAEHACEHPRAEVGLERDAVVDEQHVRQDEPL